MSDDIKILCDCGSEKEPAWCNGRLRSNRDGPFRSFAYCEDCDSEIPVPDDNFFSHITGYKHWWAARSLRNQLQEARRQIAEQAAELERLKNPGATQYCPACVEAQKEIAALKTKRQATIDAAIKMLRIIETDHIDRGYELRLKGVRTALEAVEQIRARYQGEK